MRVARDCVTLFFSSRSLASHDMPSRTPVSSPITVYGQCCDRRSLLPTAENAFRAQIPSAGVSAVTKVFEAAHGDIGRMIGTFSATLAKRSDRTRPSRAPETAYLFSAPKAPAMWAPGKWRSNRPVAWLGRALVSAPSVP